MRRFLQFTLLFWLSFAEATPILRLAGRVRSVASFQVRSPTLSQFPTQKTSDHNPQLGIYLRLTSNDKELGSSQSVYIKDKAITKTKELKIALIPGQEEIFVPISSPESQVTVTFVQN